LRRSTAAKRPKSNSRDDGLITRRQKSQLLACALSVGFFRQKIHLMLCRDANDFSDVGKVVKMIEQRLQFLRWGDPEHRAGGFFRFVEITARQAYEVAGPGPNPNAIELQVKHTLLHENELLLRWMDVNRHKLTGVAVGLKSEG
jgi:hypothetical protein